MNIGVSNNLECKRGSAVCRILKVNPNQTFDLSISPWRSIARYYQWRSGKPYLDSSGEVAEAFVVITGPRALLAWIYAHWLLLIDETWRAVRGVRWGE